MHTLFLASWYALAHAWAKSGMSDEPTGGGSLGSVRGNIPATEVSEGRGKAENGYSDIGTVMTVSVGGGGTSVAWAVGDAPTASWDATRAGIRRNIRAPRGCMVVVEKGGLRSPRVNAELIRGGNLRCKYQ